PRRRHMAPLRTPRHERPHTRSQLMNRNRKILAASVIAAVLGLSACTTEADTVNHNLDKDAESFKIVRRIQFVNGITDRELLLIEGRCSLEYHTKKIDVTCKVDGEKQ